MESGVGKVLPKKRGTVGASAPPRCDVLRNWRRVWNDSSLGDFMGKKGDESSVMVACSMDNRIRIKILKILAPGKLHTTFQLLNIHWFEKPLFENYLQKASPNSMSPKILTN